MSILRVVHIVAENSETVLGRLAEWAAGVQLEDVPAAGIAAAKRSILDAIGVTFAALDEPIAPVLEAYIGDQIGSASVIGRPERVSAETAALVNGALSHALDFDDVTHFLGGHPTVPILWPALAVAEARGGSGADVLRAFCIAMEVQCAIGRGVNFHHYDHGWHPTATLGGFGAATAAAIAGGLDADRIAVALAYATASAAGIKSSFGTMGKPIQVGRAAQNGVFNAALATAGATANVGAMEAKQGFANIYDGAENVNLDDMTAHLGDPWNSVDPGIWLKLYPCCGGTHSAIESAISIHRDIASPDDIESVEAFIHPRRFAHLDRPDPTGPLDAKFSLQHTVALALLHGRVRMDHFTDAAILDPELVALRDRISGFALPADRQGPEHFAAEVHVLMKDGTRHVQRQERANGRTPETAFTDEEIEDKFRACTEKVLDREQQDRLIELVATLDQQDHLDELTGLLRAQLRVGASRGEGGEHRQR